MYLVYIELYVVGIMSNRIFLSLHPPTQAHNWVKAIQSTMGAEQINALHLLISYSLEMPTRESRLNGYLGAILLLTFD